MNLASFNAVTSKVLVGFDPDARLVGVSTVLGDGGQQFGGASGILQRTSVGARRSRWRT